MSSAFRAAGLGGRTAAGESLSRSWRVARAADISTQSSSSPPPEGKVRVVVYDGDENPPVMRELSAESWERGGGRGLYLVDSLTEGRWGHGPDIPYGGQTHPEGKAVWFDLSVPRPAAP